MGLPDQEPGRGRFDSSVRDGGVWGGSMHNWAREWIRCQGSGTYFQTGWRAIRTRLGNDLWICWSKQCDYSLFAVFDWRVTWWCLDEFKKGSKYWLQGCIEMSLHIHPTSHSPSCKNWSLRDGVVLCGGHHLWKANNAMLGDYWDYRRQKNTSMHWINMNRVWCKVGWWMHVPRHAYHLALCTDYVPNLIFKISVRVFVVPRWRITSWSVKGFGRC